MSTYGLGLEALQGNPVGRGTELDHRRRLEQDESFSDKPRPQGKKRLESLSG
jgi:hypothetical protein